MDRQLSRQIAYSGIFIALILGIGYALAFIPNVELITAMIFLAGVLMGFRRGIMIGIIGEFLFSALNPMGSGLLFPPLLLTQVLAMTLVSLSGATLRHFVINFKPGLKDILIIGGTGLGLTLIYDVFTSAAFPISAGFTFHETVATIIAGLAFSTVHLISNVLVFVLLVPNAAQQTYKAIPFFSETYPVKYRS